MHPRSAVHSPMPHQRAHALLRIPALTRNPREILLARNLLTASVYIYYTNLLSEEKLQWRRRRRMMS